MRAGSIASGISLANKVQLLFSAAVVLIIVAALIVPWFRLVTIIDQSQFEATRQIARFWEQRPFIDEDLNVGWYREPTDTIDATPTDQSETSPDPSATPAALTLGFWPIRDWQSRQLQSPFLIEARQALTPPPLPDTPASTSTPSGQQTTAPPEAQDPANDPAASTNPSSDTASSSPDPRTPPPAAGDHPANEASNTAGSPATGQATPSDAAPTPPDEPEPDPTPAPLREFRQAVWSDNGAVRIYRIARVITDDEGDIQGVVAVERRSLTAAGQLFVNRLFLVIAGLLAGLVAVAAFYVITRRIVLGPVRSLRDTAELVRGGAMHIRSDIRTNDEFEQLADAFNSMLQALEDQQAQLRQKNRTLDLQVVRLEEQNQQLNELARLKGEFLANISHELRTPLNAIIGFADILAEIVTNDQGTLEAGETLTLSPAQLAKRERYIAHIIVAGKRLLEMINELLTMARLDAGRVDVTVQPVDLAELIETLRAMIVPLADRASIDVRLEIEREDGSFTDDPHAARLPVIHTDPAKVHQILFNFLSNAVKFTPNEGLVRIRVEREQADRDAPRIKLSIVDSGPGIDPALHSAIFEKFRQIDGGHTREHQQGTGLGLAIAKDFADMIHAQITIDSSKGRGSAFALILPLSITPPNPPTSAAAHPTRAEAAGDDDPADPPSNPVPPPPGPRHPPRPEPRQDARTDLWRD